MNYMESSLASSTNLNRTNLERLNATERYIFLTHEPNANVQNESLQITQSELMKQVHNELHGIEQGISNELEPNESERLNATERYNF
jgi:hypothetical protein